MQATDFFLMQCEICCTAPLLDTTSFTHSDRIMRASHSCFKFRVNTTHKWYAKHYGNFAVQLDSLHNRPNTYIVVAEVCVKKKKRSMIQKINYPAFITQYISWTLQKKLNAAQQISLAYQNNTEKHSTKQHSTCQHNSKDPSKCVSCLRLVFVSPQTAFLQLRVPFLSLCGSGMVNISFSFFFEMHIYICTISIILRVKIYWIWYSWYILALQYIYQYNYVK